VADRALVSGDTADQNDNSTVTVTTGSTFTSPAHNTDFLFLVEGSYSPPTTCTGGPANGDVKLSVDSTPLYTFSFVSGGGHGVQSVAPTPVWTMGQFAPGQHTISVTEAKDNCTGTGEQGQFSGEVDVIPLR
jgi:hypothetical protein